MFGISGFGFWVLGSGFRVSGFGFRVSTFGFLVSGFEGGTSCAVEVVLEGFRVSSRVDIRLHGKGNSNLHGARPVYSNHLDDTVDSDQ